VLLVFLYGMLNFTPMVLLPPMLKQLGGFPESIIGTLIAGRGTGAVIGFFLAGHMAKVDPRIGMTIGYVMQAWSGYIMWNFNADVSSADVMFTSLLQGVCVGLIWVPLTVSTFSRVDPAHLGETSAIFHLIRNLGSSIFISLSVTTVIRSQTANFGDLRTYITPFSENFQAFSALTGVGLENAADLARLNVMITNEAQLVGFLNAFGLYTVVSLAVLPFIWMVRVPKKDGG
ncbi:MAG: MFS transporter, partial [Rhodospirillaceae bacterium]